MADFHSSLDPGPAGLLCQRWALDICTQPQLTQFLRGISSETAACGDVAPHQTGYGPAPSPLRAPPHLAARAPGPAPETQGAVTAAGGHHFCPLGTGQMEPGRPAFSAAFGSAAKGTGRASRSGGESSEKRLTRPLEVGGVAALPGKGRPSRFPARSAGPASRRPGWPGREGAAGGCRHPSVRRCGRAGAAPRTSPFSGNPPASSHTGEFKVLHDRLVSSAFRMPLLSYSIRAAELT
ncbi:uncharacterized protein LOC144248320 [Lonchura striata]